MVNRNRKKLHTMREVSGPPTEYLFYESKTAGIWNFKLIPQNAGENILARKRMQMNRCQDKKMNGTPFAHKKNNN